jgi:chromosomal replication initiation ATPase DnaA
MLTKKPIALERCSPMEKMTPKEVAKYLHIRDAVQLRLAGIIEQACQALAGETGLNVSSLQALRLRLDTDSPLTEVHVSFELAPRGDKPAPASAAPPHPSESDIDAQTTFDSFLTAASNQAAFDAARRLAERSGKTPRLLWLYGAANRGKTHLLHAIANERRNRYPETCLRCLEALAYAEELAQSSRNGVQALARHAPKLDLLLIDDLDVLAQRLGRTGNLGAVLDALLGECRQLVVTSRGAPQSLPQIAEKLAQMPAAHVVEIEKPNGKTLLAIAGRMDDVLRAWGSERLDPKAVESALTRRGAAAPAARANAKGRARRAKA